MGGIEGVEIRGTSIRIVFYYEGKQYKERLTVNGKSLQPSPANMKYAAKVAQEVKRKISLKIFDWLEYFPDSKNAHRETPKTFGAIADLWLESKRHLVDGTFSGYKRSVAMWKDMFGADTNMEKITHQVLAAKIGGYPWPSAQTVNNYLITIRGIMAFEYRGEKASKNPMIGINNFKKTRRLPDPFTPDERDLILAKLKNSYDIRAYAYFLFAFYTGMRPEEITPLKWADVDFRLEKVRISRVKAFRGLIRKGSKTHSERDVDLVDQAMEAIEIMRPYTQLKSEFIFENPVTGKPWRDTQHQRNNFWKPTLMRLGIRWRPPYNTRHTYATVALMAGVKPAYIARQLGHANSQMLHEKYARWIDEADKGSEKNALRKAFGCAETIPKVSQNNSKVS